MNVQDDYFASLYFDLIKGGIAPRHARRAARELRQHHQDLEANALAAGATAAEAREQARQALGTREVLVNQYLARAELRSWSSRFPKALYLLGPLLAFVALALLLVVTYVAAGSAFELMDSSTRMPDWYYWLGHALLGFVIYLLMPLLVLGFCMAARRRLMPLQWPLVGAVLLALLGSGFTYILDRGGPTGGDGVLGIAWGWHFLPRPLSVEGNHSLWKILPTLALLWLVVRHYRPGAPLEN